MSSQSEDTELVSADHYAYDILDLPSLLTPLPLPPPHFLILMEVKLPYDLVSPFVSLFVGRPVCLFVCHNFLKGQEVDFHAPIGALVFTTLAYIAVRDLQSSHRNASIQSILLACNFLYKQ